MSNDKPAPIEIDQTEDFAQFTIDGHTLDVDLYLASEKISAIERAHRNDSWQCFDCEVSFTTPDGTGAEGDPLKCPGCKSESVRRDESWLDDVAAFVRSLGAKRCGRNAAGKFQQAVAAALDTIKKKLDSTPGLPGGST